MNLFKWLTIPNGETEQIKAYEKWTVRWRSRHGGYFADTQPEAEVFTSEDDAERFASALREAFAIIRHTSGTQVNVKKG